jgi:hypothetical protein
MKKFNYIGPLNPTGYGNASIGFFKSILKDNPSVSLLPIGNPDQTIQDVPTLLKAIENKPSYDDPSFCFWHFHDMHQQISSFKGPIVGYSTFEIDTLNPIEVKVLDKLQSVATASEWGRNILQKYTNKEVHVVHHAFKDDDSVKLGRVSFDYSSNYEAWNKFLAPVKFPKDSLFLSTAGKFEVRKSHPEIIQACLEYGKQNPVVLIAFVHNPFMPDNFPYSYINYNMFYPMYTSFGIKVYKKDNFYLVLMPRALEKQELHSALSKTHFFVSPSKAEGWNLPLFEMMSIGMPCITTLYSAHTEYCNANNVISVDFDGLTSANDGVFFKGTGNWANVRKDNILNAIKKAHSMIDNKDAIKGLSDLALHSTSAFTWQKEARKIQSLMNRL